MYLSRLLHNCDKLIRTKLEFVSNHSPMFSALFHDGAFNHHDLHYSISSHSQLLQSSTIFANYLFVWFQSFFAMRTAAILLHFELAFFFLHDGVCHLFNLQWQPMRFNHRYNFLCDFEKVTAFYIFGQMTNVKFVSFQVVFTKCGTRHSLTVPDFPTFNRL